MNGSTQNNAPTIESLAALQQEFFRQMIESNRQREKEKAERDRQFEEEKLKREEEKAERDRQFEEEKLKREKEKAERDRQRERDNAAYEKRMKRMDEEMGRWTNNQGCFAEEYFYNSFDYGEQNFFGEHFDSIEKNLKCKTKKLRDEYDIVLYNGTSVAIIEVKYKAHKNDVTEVLKKAETFKILCPDYKDFKIYLGLASMTFYPELEQECIKQGIAIIKQVGDTVVINDTCLQVF